MSTVPNIPGINSSVIDRSETTTVIADGRVPLIAGFFKYGEGFKYFYTPKDLEYYMGGINTFRYGLAMEFAKDAFLQTSKVLTYRVVSPNATYSNYTLRIKPEGLSQNVYSATSKVIIPDSIENIKTKEDLVLKIDGSNQAGENKIIFSLLAKGKGKGYDDIFATFSPSIDYEKLDANREGETNYKFNFIKVEIFESVDGSVKSMGAPFIISLMDRDEITNQPISDMYTGDELYVNSISKLKNHFMTLMINESENVISEMRKYSTIDSLISNNGQKNRLILLDNSTGITKKFEVIMMNGSLVKRIKPDAYTYNSADNVEYLSYVGSDDNTYYAKVVLGADGKPTIVTANPTDTTNIKSAIYIDGDDAYYKLTAVLGTDSTLTLKAEPVSFLRWNLYNFLLTNNIKLDKGSDDDSLFTSSGMLNLPYRTLENNTAISLMVDFFNNNQEIQEVLYPRWDFDYVPDWSNNVAINNAIMSFGDKVGLTMPLINIPPKYNPGLLDNAELAKDADLETRGTEITGSSYNAMIYSSQLNKDHISNTNRLKLRMPASYYAMLAHLKVDKEISITEPVANVIKGNIQTSNNAVNLTYYPTSWQIQYLREAQINTIISEPDGTYFIDQLTAYKKASKLSRGHTVKVIHRMRKDLPRLLKDLLHNKAITNVKETALERAYKYVNKYLITSDNYTDGLFQTVSINAIYNSETYTLRLSISVNPVGTIEVIDIPIIVI